MLKKVRYEIMAGICLCLVALAVAPGSVLAGNCNNPKYAENHPEECAPPVLRTLMVTVRFGDEDSLDTCATNCVETTFETTGTVNCTSHTCDFSGSASGAAPVFGLSPALFNLLALTSYKQTQIEPEGCFDVPPPHGIPYPESGETKDVILSFHMRSPFDSSPDLRWYGKVRADSTDMDGVVQRYGFHFNGPCDRTSGTDCPDLANPDVKGTYQDGIVEAVFGTGRQKKGQPQTCRCTVSSSPTCPANVDMGALPRPAAWIEIVEL